MTSTREILIDVLGDYENALLRCVHDDSVEAARSLTVARKELVEHLVMLLGRQES